METLKISILYCARCGAKLPNGNGRFCPKCGAQIEVNDGNAKGSIPPTAVKMASGVLVAIWTACFASGGAFSFASNVNFMIGNNEMSLQSYLVALLVMGALMGIGSVVSDLMSYLGLCFIYPEYSTGANANELLDAFPKEDLLNWNAVAYYLVSIANWYFLAFPTLGQYYWREMSNPLGWGIMEAGLLFVVSLAGAASIWWLLGKCFHLRSR